MSRRLAGHPHPMHPGFRRRAARATSTTATTSTTRTPSLIELQDRVNRVLAGLGPMAVHAIRGPVTVSMSTLTEDQGDLLAQVRTEVRRANPRWADL